MNETTASFTMQPIGRFGSQSIDFNPSNGHVYVGGRKAENIGDAIRKRSKLQYTISLTRLDDKDLARVVAHGRLKLSELGPLVEVKDKNRFLNLLTHEVARVRPNGRGEDSHEVNEEFNSILDEANHLYNGHK